MNIQNWPRKLSLQFNLRADMESEEEILKNIRKDAEFKGANLWILILAIIIASVGLNVNSTAVIIGAMLISPLMGPLIALGVALSLQDFNLIKIATRSLGFALFASLTASTIYFLLTPLDQPQNEIINRTTPTIFDVFIAFAGGIAGMIAMSRKTRGNVLPGVAIATALMPPLCTAGFGIASGNIQYFLGAFYLFFINCVFILVGTFVVVSFLRFHRSENTDQFLGLKIQRIIAITVVVTLLPSGYLAYQLIRRTVRDQKIEKFIVQEVTSLGLVVLQQKFTDKENGTEIKLSVLGDESTPESRNELSEKLKYYGLPHSTLKLNFLGTNASDISQLKHNLRDEFRKTNSEDHLKDKRVALLEAELSELRKFEVPQKVHEELAVLYPKVSRFLVSGTTLENKKILLVFAITKERISSSDVKKLSEWLRVRMNTDEVRISVEKI